MMSLGVWIFCAAVWHKQESRKITKILSLVAAIAIGAMFTLAGK